MRINQWMVQMAKVANAQARDFKNENRIGILFAKRAAYDVCCDVAHQHVLNLQKVFGGTGLAPAGQDMLYSWVGASGEVRHVGLVHRPGHRLRLGPEPQRRRRLRPDPADVPPRQLPAVVISILTELQQMM